MDNMNKHEEEALKARACCFCFFWRRGAFCKLLDLDTVNQHDCTPENGKRLFVSKEAVMRHAWDFALREVERNQMVACHFLLNGECLLKKLEPTLTCPHRRKNDNCGLLGEPIANLKRFKDAKQTLDEFKKMMDMIKKVKKYPTKGEKHAKTATPRDKTV